MQCRVASNTGEQAALHNSLIYIQAEQPSGDTALGREWVNDDPLEPEMQRPPIATWMK